VEKQFLSLTAENADHLIKKLIDQTKLANVDKRNFNLWLSSFRNSIADYNYYIDFKKVYANVSQVKVELNILNSLIGSTNIKSDFVSLLNRYPEVIRCIPLLLAVRAKEIYCQDDRGGFLYNFDVHNLPPDNSNAIEQYAYFMEKVGLFNLIQQHIINNLVDYVTGIETGLDSNGRKNRGGKLMERLVESFIQKAGFVLNESYFKELKIREISKRWGLDLSSISNKGKLEKRFDFVIKTPSKTYAIETNFYASGGSKLNETARSYKNLAIESSVIPDFDFVWFTDGKGWQSARNNLEETFDVMEHLYNINDLENGVIGKVIT